MGRIRYIGVLLYDADRVEEAASIPDEKELLDAQRSIFLDPHDPEVIEQARFDGIPEDWIEAAQRSPLYKLAIEWGVALPLHPEYRTLPMVWYVPPLSPVMSLIEDGEPDPDAVFPAIEEMRIPNKYLANLLTAGDEEEIKRVLRRLAAMRAYMRELDIAGEADPRLAEDADLGEDQIVEMYRLLAIAKYDERYVIPKAHKELALELDAHAQGSCGLDFAGGPGSCASVEGTQRNEAFYSMKEELEEKTRAMGGRLKAPNVNFFRSKADFEAFHLKEAGA